MTSMHSHVLRCWIWIKGLCLLSVFSALPSSDDSTEKLQISALITAPKPSKWGAQKHLVQMLTRHAYMISIICTDLQIMSSYSWKIYILQATSLSSSQVLLRHSIKQSILKWLYRMKPMVLHPTSSKWGGSTSDSIFSISLFSPAKRPRRRLSSRVLQPVPRVTNISASSLHKPS